MGMLTLNASYPAATPGSVAPDILAEFHSSAILGNSLVSWFLLGYVFGPIIFAPLSERYGRKPIFLWAFFPYCAFQLACALAPNMAALIVFRFFGGVMAGCPLSNTAAVLADMCAQRCPLAVPSVIL
jgi:MFS family permease